VTLLAAKIMLFGADAAAGTLIGLAALTAFVVVYGRIATLAGPIPSSRWSQHSQCRRPSSSCARATCPP
jgi:hypothetical protein